MFRSVFPLGLFVLVLVLVLVLSVSGTRTLTPRSSNRGGYRIEYEYEYHFIEYEYERKPKVAELQKLHGGHLPKISGMSHRTKRGIAIAPKMLTPIPANNIERTGNRR